MSRSTIVLLSVLGFLVLVLLWGVGRYNNLVSLDEGASGQWANVESAYQRRSDLIPNLVNTVKGYANFERETLEAVVNARAKATSVTVDPANLSPEKLAAFQQAQAGVGSALGRLLVTVEKYPDLKANQNFLDLQKQLEGTENRIKVERDRFNEAVKGYNVAVKRFPGNIIAGMTGFESKGYFEAEAGTEKAPGVNFE
jgi:LemA protein